MSEESLLEGILERLEKLNELRLGGGPIGPATPVMGLGPDNRPKSIAVDSAGKVMSSGGSGGGGTPGNTVTQVAVDTGQTAGASAAFSRVDHAHELLQAGLSLSGLGEKDHGSLNSIGADQHHNQSHAHDGADGSGQVSFPDLLNIPSVSLASVFGAGLLSARPAAGNVANFYYATDVNGGQLYRDNGATWALVAAPNNPVSTNIRGGNWKNFYTNGSGVVTELALGALATYLRSGGTAAAPTWAVIALTEAVGGNWKIVYTNGSGVVTELALGAAGTVLKSAGASSAPSFTTIAITETTGNNWKVVYTNGAGVVTELALGAAGTYLRGGGVSAAPTFATIAQTELTGGTWKVTYTDGSGVVTEVALGASGTVLMSNGAALAPTFQTPAGGGTSNTLLAIKTSSDTTLNSNTYANSATLHLALAAGGVYQVEIFIPYVYSAGTPGLKLLLHNDDTLTITNMLLVSNQSGWPASGTIVAALETNIIAGAAGTGARIAVIVGTIEVNAAGTLVVQWAQNSTDATNLTTIKRGAYIKCVKTNP